MSNYTYSGAFKKKCCNYGKNVLWTTFVICAKSQKAVHLLWLFNLELKTINWEYPKLHIHLTLHQAMESHLNSKTFLVLFFLTFAQTCYGAVVLFSSLPQTLVVSASPKEGQGNTLSFQLSLISIMLCIELIRIEWAWIETYYLSLYSISYIVITIANVERCSVKGKVQAAKGLLGRSLRLSPTPLEYVVV